ncbi:hypothetical protein COT48_03145 [Candidatus Woesearchaeota archaeon CG08_land_8_20_14_0_20_47_9]|nr:MAG: hypothetical protein AUJ69_03115 [Candidatus Woesearchaeota archaeon CG1_02_47_18]PIO03923.1 MAG: hypothetical protein COT48_03145 [Candidatus Woesearchaeota archaeon CG08_land_8_20_14_0_20_47_9]HII29708.1 M23 family metallopeptidase [Candidatus Woesearchaeota archaeon]
MKLGKRGSSFFWLLLAVAVIIASASIMAIISSKMNKLTSQHELGQGYIDLITTYQKGENARYYVSESGRLAVQQAAFDMAYTGLSGCGTYKGRFVWGRPGENEGYENCAPDDNKILSAFNNGLSSGLAYYLDNYKTLYLPNNYVTLIESEAGSTGVTAQAMQKLFIEAKPEIEYYVDTSFKTNLGHDLLSDYATLRQLATDIQEECSESADGSEPCVEDYISCSKYKDLPGCADYLTKDYKDFQLYLDNCDSHETTAENIFDDFVEQLKSCKEEKGKECICGSFEADNEMSELQSYEIILEPDSSGKLIAQLNDKAGRNIAEATIEIGLCSFNDGSKEVRKIDKLSITQKDIRIDDGADNFNLLFRRERNKHVMRLIKPDPAKAGESKVCLLVPPGGATEKIETSRCGKSGGGVVVIDAFSDIEMSVAENLRTKIQLAGGAAEILREKYSQPEERRKRFQEIERENGVGVFISLYDRSNRLNNLRYKTISECTNEGFSEIECKYANDCKNIDECEDNNLCVLYNPLDGPDFESNAIAKSLKDSPFEQNLNKEIIKATGITSEVKVKTLPIKAEVLSCDLKLDDSLISSPGSSVDGLTAISINFYSSGMSSEQFSEIASALFSSLKSYMPGVSGNYAFCARKEGAQVFACKSDCKLRNIDYRFALKISNSKDAEMSMIWPVDVWTFNKKHFISSCFGKRKDPIEKVILDHNAIDIAVPNGKDVKAVAEGEVYQICTDGQNNVDGNKGWGKCWRILGNFVVIDHNNGVYSRYSHLSEVSVNEGDHVMQGGIIGKVGNTGRSTGDHLDFSIFTLDAGSGVDMNFDRFWEIKTLNGFTPQNPLCYLPRADIYYSCSGGTDAAQAKAADECKCGHSKDIICCS